MTKTRLIAALSCSLGLISCGSSSTTSSIDTGTTIHVIDASSTVNGIDASLTVNGIDASSTVNGIDASSTVNVIDASLTTNDIDASLTTNDIDGGPNYSCPDLAGAYILTTQIVSTTCKVGLNVVTQPITYTFKQTAPSCNFTMTASLYSGSAYSGHFVMAGGKAKVLWDSVNPAPTILGSALSYTGEDLSITPGATAATSTIVGSFTWHSAASCDGTTNVCNGSIPAGCPTPK